MVTGGGSRTVGRHGPLPRVTTLSLPAASFLLRLWVQKGAEPQSKFVAIITCAARARGLLSSLVVIPPLPPASRGPGVLSLQWEGVWEDHEHLLRNDLHRGCCDGGHRGVLCSHRLKLVRLLRRTRLPSNERGAPVQGKRLPYIHRELPTISVLGDSNGRRWMTKREGQNNSGPPA